MKFTGFFSLIFALVFCFSFKKANAQGIVQKVELKVAPFFMSYYLFTKEDLDSVDLTIFIKESALEPSTDQVYSILTNPKGKKEIEAGNTDYRVKCIFYLYSGKVEVLYMNPLGEFLYNDRTYKNKSVMKFVFDHIPQEYR